MNMYLILFINFVLINGVQPDCGCSTNRESKCESNENPHEKYAQEKNIPAKDSDNIISTDNTLENMVFIKRNIFLMGTDKPYFEADFEGPARNVSVKSFYMDKYEVSNKDFDEFVKKTGYITEAENFGDSFIFELLVDEKERENYKDFRAVQAPWWIKMKGVDWRHPEGPNSNINGNLFIALYKYLLYKYK